MRISQLSDFFVNHKMSEEATINFYLDQAQVYIDEHPEILTIQNVSGSKKELRDFLCVLKEYPSGASSHNRAVIAKAVTKIFAEQAVITPVQPSGEQSESSSVSVFKPTQTIVSKRNRGSLPSFDSTVPSSTRNTKCATKSVTVTRAVLNGVNVMIPETGFRPNNDIGDFSDLTDDITPSAYEDCILDFMVGSENSQLYFDALESAKDATETIIRKHPAPKGNQVPKLDKAERVYKLLSSDTVGEKVTCTDDEVEALFERDRICIEMEKLWKERSKSIDFLDYFKLESISSHNVIALKDLKPVLSMYKMSAVINKFLNSVLTSENAPLDKLEYVTNKYSEQNGSNTTGYVTLFTDTFKSSGTGLRTLIPNLFNHRAGIIHHRSVTSEFKKECWLSARANVNSIDRSSLQNDREREVVDAWSKLLNSRFFYHIFMNGASPCELVKKAIKTLLIEGKSFHMYAAELYPIAWVFTPLWCGFNGLIIKELFNNETEYKAEIKGVFQKICDSNSNLINFEQCNWLYYRGKEGKNVLAGLFYHQLTSVSTEKVEKKVRK
jgi:hypothetical protein